MKHNKNSMVRAWLLKLLADLESIEVENAEFTQKQTDSTIHVKFKTT